MEKIKCIVDELKDYAQNESSVISTTVAINHIAQSAVMLIWNQIKNSTDHW